MRRVVRANKDDGTVEQLDVEYVNKLAKAYKSTKDAIKSFTSQADKLKAELTQYVDRHGHPDEHGSLWLDVGDVKLKRERRVSKTLNTTAAETWAKENGYWEEVSEVIPEHRELDEDKLLRLAWESGDPALTQAVQNLYAEKEIWAFKAH